MVAFIALITGYAVGVWNGAAIASVVYRAPAPEREEIETVWGRF